MTIHSLTRFGYRQGTPESEINAKDLLAKVAPLVDGRGGGKPHLAQGGGQNLGGIDAFIAEFPKTL